MQGHSTPHYCRGIEGKNAMLFCVGAIKANYFGIFFHAVLINGGWVMIARKNQKFWCVLASAYFLNDLGCRDSMSDVP